MQIFNGAAAGRSIYSLLLALCAPLVWLWMARRARRAGGDWQILGRTRFGRYPHAATQAAPVWIHAVSLGETRAAEPLVRALLQRGLPVLLTHTTATGRAEGARLFGQALQDGQLAQAWLPYDFPGATRRFLAHFQPRCGVLIEREIWPNLLAAARRRRVPMVLASARFSDSSLAQARWLGPVFREALAGLAAVLAQTPADAERLRQAGATDVEVLGNLKFDVSLPAAQLAAGQAWRAALGRPALVIASTREGEEAPLVRALAAALLHHATGGVHASTAASAHAAAQDAPAHAESASPIASVTSSAPPLCFVVPRHPQRFDAAAQALEQAGLTMLRRSAQPGPPPATVQAVLGDSLGEMPFYYAACDVAIVAGSFAPFGGHNLIEACAAGRPVIVGPHTENFKQAVEDALAAGAALRAADADEALRLAFALLADPARRTRMAEAARAWIAGHAGATERIVARLPLA